MDEFASDTHVAHPYVDIAHRATWLNLTAAIVAMFSFAVEIATYIAHGIRRDTTNQFEHTDASLRAAMTALILGEIGGFAVLSAGFVAGQFF